MRAIRRRSCFTAPDEIQGLRQSQFANTTRRLSQIDIYPRGLGPFGPEIGTEATDTAIVGEDDVLGQFVWKQHGERRRSVLCKGVG